MCWLLIINRGQSIWPSDIYNVYALSYAIFMMMLFILSIIFHYRVYLQYSRTDNPSNRPSELKFKVDFLQRFNSNFWITLGVVVLIPAFLSRNVMVIIWWPLVISLVLMLPVHIISPILSIFYLRRYPEARETNY